MKFLIIGDLYGNMPNLMYNKFDTIIALGDFCGSNETWGLMFQVLKKRLNYPKSKVKWYDICGKSEA